MGRSLLPLSARGPAHRERGLRGKGSPRIAIPITRIPYKPFSKEVQREQIRRLAEEVGSPVRLVHCVAPDDVVRRWLERAARRNPRNLAADRTFAKYLRIKAAFEPIVGPHLAVDTGGDPDDAIEACVRYLCQAEERS